ISSSSSVSRQLPTKDNSSGSAESCHMLFNRRNQIVRTEAGFFRPPGLVEARHCFGRAVSTTSLCGTQCKAGQLVRRNLVHPLRRLRRLSPVIFRSANLVAALDGRRGDARATETCPISFPLR